MHFRIGDRVRILRNHVVGEIIDTTVGKHDGKTYYIVESCTEALTDDPRAYPSAYPLYDCLAEEITHI